MQVHTGHVLGGTAVLAPAIAIFAPLGLTVLLCLSGVAVLVSRRIGEDAWPSPPMFPSLVMALMLVWSLIGAIWSIDAETTLTRLPRILGITVAGLVVMDAALHLQGRHLRSVQNLLLAGFLVALVLLAGERMLNGPIRGIVDPDIESELALWTSFNRGVTVVVLFVWPASLVLWWRNRKLAALAWAVTLGVISTYSSGAAILSLAAGGIVFALTRLGPRIVPTVLAGLVAMFILASPLLFGKLLDRETINSEQTSVPRSGYHRLLIWNFTADRIFERPFAGWGLDSSRSMPRGKIRLGYSNEQPLPLHPHNSALQVWLELGLPGAVLATALMAWILLTVRNGARDATVKAAMTGLCITALGISFLSYGMWQSWWMSALWLGVVFAATCWHDDTAAVPNQGVNP